MDFFPVYFGVAEGMRELRKADFVLVKDANFKFKYYKVSNKLAKFAMSYILFSEWGLECDWLCLGWLTAPALFGRPQLPSGSFQTVPWRVGALCSCTVCENLTV